MITAERLRAALDYDPATGGFRWKQPRRNAAVRAGDVAGSRQADGKSVHIQVDGRMYQAHRLAWLHVTGRWPSQEIDHRNRDGTDNRWANLREASFAQNQHNRGLPRNNTSGVKGVHRCAQTGKWSAQIMVDGKRLRLGRFDLLDDAADAVRAKRVELHGQFANHG